VETNRTGGIKMAFITDILNTIKNARKGKDMRQAIYDGIQQCYKDATGHPDSVAAVVERLKIEKGRIDELATSQTFTGNYTQSNLVFHAYRNAITGDPDPDDSYNYEGTSGKHEMPICKIFQEGTLDFAEKQSNEKVKILKEGLYIFELRIFISGSGKLDIEARINDVSQRYNAWQIVAQSTEETKIIAYILYLKGDDVVSFYGTPGLQASVRAPVSDVNCYVLDWIGKAQISDCSKEISDIRVGEDGAVYGTAGEAVRKQIGNLTEDLSNKITKFYASNQGETHLADSDSGKIMDMMLYGKSSQDGTPSVENPVEIKSVVNPAIKICGKNLFDSKKFPIISNRAIDTNTGAMYESLSGNYCATEKYIPFPYSGKKISFNASMSLCAYDKDYKFISTVNKNNGQVPTGTMYVRFDIKTEEKDKAQIELSENATTYEPYKEQTIQLPITLNAIPVSSDGNVTINGQQYVADYVDVERGKVVRCVKREPLSKNGRLSSSSSPFYTYNLPSAKPKTITEVFALCNLAQFNSITTSNSQIGISSDGSNSLRMRLDGYATLEQYTRLSAEIIYELATPIEEDLTSEQIQSLQELKTKHPVTNIFITSDQLDGYTTFNYPISMANGWNYVKKQLSDNRDYIYDMDTTSAESYVNSEYAVALTELEV
jgi:hypothetical protein